MSDIYDYILKSNKIDEIMDYILNGENILIVENTKDFFKNDNVKLKECGLNIVELNEDFEENKKLINNKLDRVELKTGEMSKINLLRREIANKKNLIIEIFNSFIEKNQNGTSLNDLYCSTYKVLEFKDKEFKLFNLLNKIEYLNNNSKQISLEIDSVIRNSQIELFLKYKRFSQSKNFELIKDNINKSDIDKIINRLKGLLNNPFAFTAPIYFNKYTTDFIEEKVYYSKTKEEFYDKISEINFKHNGKMLSGKRKISVFTPNLWFKAKEVNLNNERLDMEYETIKKKITSEYEENIENLNMFVKSFSFLNKVFISDAGYEIKNCLLNQEELINYIETLKNNLEIYKKYLKIEREINSLNIHQLNILNNCYDILDNKSDLREIIEFIPNYLNYLLIEKYEEINSKSLSCYNNIEDELSKLSTALKRIKEHIYKVLCNKNVLAIIDEDIYNQQEGYLKERFSYILKCPDIDEKLNSSMININKKESNDSLDRNIIKVLLNLGYIYKKDENNCSILYLESNVIENKDSVIYINRNLVFDENDLLELIKLVDNHNNVLFLWYRNWWLDKYEEIKKINRFINNM